MIKEFRKIGYEIVPGGNGSHVKMKQEGCPTVIIPLGKELSPIVIKSLEKVYNLVLIIKGLTKPISSRKTMACAIEDDVFIERIPDSILAAHSPNLKNLVSHQLSKNVMDNVVCILNDNWIPIRRLAKTLFGTRHRSSDLFASIRKVKNGKRITKKMLGRLAKATHSSEEKLLETPPPPLSKASKIFLERIDKIGIVSISHAEALLGVSKEKLYRVINLRETTFTDEEIFKIREYTGFEREIVKPFTSPGSTPVAIPEEPTFTTISEAKTVSDNLTFLGSENWLPNVDIAKNVTGSSDVLEKKIVEVSDFPKFVQSSAHQLQPNSEAQKFMSNVKEILDFPS